MNRKSFAVMAAFLVFWFFLTGCGSMHHVEKGNADTSKWFSVSRDSDVDVFYIVSTNVASSVLPDGRDTYRASLTEDDIAAMEKEASFVAEMFQGMNVYAPYYHQFTLSALYQPAHIFDSLYLLVRKEMCEHFDHFLKVNDGRPFILCGFSQGAMLVQDLLRYMDDDTYRRCIAAYSLGYRLSKEDLKHPHIQAAASDDDLGVTVSFNSVSDTSAVWGFVTNDAVTCMNPVNWHTDTISGAFNVGNVKVKVHVDPTYNVLVVDGLNPTDYYIPALSAFCKIGNYHLGDLVFYSQLIGDNARLRAARFHR